jgi:hypothetical protein
MMSGSIPAPLGEQDPMMATTPNSGGRMMPPPLSQEGSAGFMHVSF